MLNPLAVFVTRAKDELAGRLAYPIAGRVMEVTGTLVKAYVPDVEIGEICSLRDTAGRLLSEGEIVGFDKHKAILTLYGDIPGLSSLTEVLPVGRSQTIGVGEEVLGRVLDGMGRPLDEKTKGPLKTSEFWPVYSPPPAAMERAIISRPLPLGVRALDGMLTCGEGQRIGIFAAAGGGKSTLLSSLVLGTEAEITVIALIGERGREVREFIEHNLGEEGMRRAVIIVATSDKASMERARAAYAATAVAEYFRARGGRVLFLMDSVTRFARALREIGLAAGEPPARRGFPPSVFATLPKLMERTGMSATGSITAFYTVLTEGDDMTEPVADETRSILDGHVILSRALAQSGHYPAIDILQSASRVMPNIVSADHLRAATEARRLLAAWQESEFLIKIGEYQKGSDPLTDRAIDRRDAINKFLRQPTRESSGFGETLAALQALAA